MRMNCSAQVAFPFNVFPNSGRMYSPANYPSWQTKQQYRGCSRKQHQNFHTAPIEVIAELRGPVAIVHRVQRRATAWTQLRQSTRKDGTCLSSRLGAACCALLPRHSDPVRVQAGAGVVGRTCPQLLGVFSTTGHQGTEAAMGIGRALNGSSSWTCRERSGLTLAGCHAPEHQRRPAPTREPGTDSGGPIAHLGSQPERGA